MCFFDIDEPCAEYNVNRNEAVGAWTCQVCRTLIPEGGWCRSDFMLQEYANGEDESDEDDWETSEVCFACDASMTRFMESHGSHAAPDWFLESLHQCFDGAQKTDPDAKEWRDAYAGILRRQRTAKRQARP